MSQPQKRSLKNADILTIAPLHQPLKKSKMTFDVYYEYTDSCHQIFHAIIESGLKLIIKPIHLIKLIAEYSSTQYQLCTECNKTSLGCIECSENDYGYSKEHQAIVCYGQNDYIRYFLNTEPEISYVEIEYTCIECALKSQCYLCGICSLQYVTEDTRICFVCKRRYCVLGSCHSAIQPRIPNDDNVYTMCKQCFNNDDINDDIIAVKLEEFRQKWKYCHSYWISIGGISDFVGDCHDCNSLNLNVAIAVQNQNENRW